MNVRIDEDGVRFRIVPADLSLLLGGSELKQRVSIGAQSFEYRILPAASAREMALAMTGNGFTLSVPHAALEQLGGLGRSKNGVSVKSGDVEISLQVDLKAYKAA
ncbi:MAG: hypothetical protein K8R48_10360 [Alphaproteobacteria bacterium]|nr:hypothetical protein [Alphaproteobacteria bacterium]